MQDSLFKKSVFTPLRVWFKPTASNPNSWRTLTNLYNQRPTWLDLAHQKLDRAVLNAYNATDAQQGWPHNITDE